MTPIVSRDIAPRGILRYGLNIANAAVVRRTADGSLVGVAIDLGTFIADRLGVAFEPVLYELTGAFTRSFGMEAWDITVVGTSPGAKKIFNFTQELFLLDYVYLAGPRRTFADVSEVDRPGIKVGVSPNGSGSQFLATNLKSAELILGPGDSKSIIAMLREGAVDVYGSNVNNLLVAAARLPGASFVPGAFQTVHFAAALPKTRSSHALQKLSQLIFLAKESGLIRKAIESAGLTGIRTALSSS